jgi:hypothetical protein
LVTLKESEGAGEHCHVGAMARLHQIIFDWLDDQSGGAADAARAADVALQ